MSQQQTPLTLKRKPQASFNSQQIPKKSRNGEEPQLELPWANECSECKNEMKKWPRNPLPADFNPKTTSIIFQQMEVKYNMEKVSPHTAAQKFSGSKETSVPVVKMFGCTQEGHSVCLSIYGFLPYIYVPVPTAKLQEGISSEQLCQNLLQALNHKLKAKLGDKAEVNEIVQAVEIEQKMSIMYFREEKIPFFKITFSAPPHITQARIMLEEGIVVPGIVTNVSYTTFESNLAFVLRFMVDQEIGGASWLELPAGKYFLVDADRRESNCTIEAEISYEYLIAHPVDDEKWSHIAPLRILSFDIECAGRPGSFPDPQHDPIIQIANYVTVQGQEKPLTKNIFMLGSCTPIIGMDVRCFKNEKDMLLAWRDFIVDIDPDLFTGYNIVNFDFGYLQDRAQKLKVDKFEFMGRLTNQKIKAKDAKFSSMQTGTRESKEWSISGRIVFDVYQVIQRDHKLSSYTLNNVSSHFLNQQKEDVHHTMITKLHEGTSDDRRRLAIYCCKDAFLPQKLLDNLMSLVNYVEMARVTGVPFSYLLSRGQGIKIVSQILRKTKNLDILMPTIKPQGQGEGFEGAKVITPKTGFYERPISTLDFSSLYPSIMQAHNLCYTTLIAEGSHKQLVEHVDYEVTPCGHRFIKSSKRKGILPQILESLLIARGNAKRLMAKETDKFKQQVYNGRQLALKVSANSVYGFTGQAVGQLPCVEISSSVTSYGRDMIIMTKDIIIEEYSTKNGYAHNSDVVYGDTDSVMVDFGVETVKEAIAVGKEAAKLVSSKFPHPIKLEFEKVYYPWLLMSKKKYAGLFWTNDEKWDKIDCKGIESVRRDNCGMVRYVVDVILQKILIDRDISAAIEFCKGVIKDILQNKVDLSLLIITKSYSRDAEDYKNPQAHVKLAERMFQRNPATAPVVGDRVPYVIIKGDKSARMWERAEDPLYALENGLTLDSQYYLEQLIAPLCRIFEPLLDNPRSVFLTGEHTRQIIIPTPKAKVGAITSFAIVREACLGCKASLKPSEKTLCVYCLPNAPEIYQVYLNRVREKEMQFQRLWTQCQNCQGSMHQEVICAANDCPIFYMRTKVYKDLGEAQQSLVKFDLSW